MADFSGWVKALELPAKITGGVFGACVVVYLLDRSDYLVLADIGVWARPAVAIVGVLSGCLFLASVISEEWGSYKAKKGQTAQESVSLAHLDKLSEQETYMVCQALNEGSPSFTSWVQASGAAQLVDKGLLIQHAGQFNRDDWPFTFQDFAWEEIEKRRDSFLEKEREYEAARNKGGRR